MFNVFRETWVAMRDLGYGNQIIKFEWKKVLGHWLSAFVWIFALWLIGSVSAWTYFAPQIKSLVTKNAPDIQVELKEKKLKVTPANSLVYGDSQNMLIIDASVSADTLDKYKSALLVGEESLWYKNEGKVTKIDYPDYNFVISKTLILNWIGQNKIKIWSGGVLLVTLFSLLSVSSLSTSQAIGLFFWALVFWVSSKLLHKQLSYLNTLKICIYASIPGIFISGFGLGNSGTLGVILPLVLFAWYSGIWIYKLPSSK